MRNGFAEPIAGAAMRIDVLLGNHDFCYVRGKRGPGSIMSIMRNLRTILEDALQAKVACAVGPYLCSHAGCDGSVGEAVFGRRAC